MNSSCAPHGPGNFKADSATLSFYSGKDGKLSVSYRGWGDWREGLGLVTESDVIRCHGIGASDVGGVGAAHPDGGRRRGRRPVGVPSLKLIGALLGAHRRAQAAAVLALEHKDGSLRGHWVGVGLMRATVRTLAGRRPTGALNVTKTLPQCRTLYPPKTRLKNALRAFLAPPAAMPGMLLRKATVSALA